MVVYAEQRTEAQMVTTRGWSKIFGTFKKLHLHVSELSTMSLAEETPDTFFNSLKIFKKDLCVSEQHQKKSEEKSLFLLYNFHAYIFHAVIFYHVHDC